MNNKEKILAVDDSTEILDFIRHGFEAKYEVHTTTTGLAALELCKQNDYLIILLDINMPNINGFETLALIKQLNLLEQPLIVFISTQDDEETTLKCFEQGADDFISKANKGAALCQKIQALINYKQVIQQIHRENTDLNSLVDTTMQQAAFYGSCFNLLCNLQNLTEEGNLADAIFVFTRQYDLKSSLEFRTNNATLSFNQNSGFCSPIEEKVFLALKDKGRIYEFNNRIIFNTTHVSLLIRNMPSKDSIEYNIQIDALAKLIEGIECRYLAMLNTRRLDLTHQVLKDKIINNMANLEKDKQKVIDDIIMQIGLSFHELEFTDSQEHFLNELIENTLLNQLGTSEGFLNVQSDLQQIIEETKPQTDIDNTEDNQFSDIELF